VDALENVEEGVGEVIVTIQRTGYLDADLELYCFTLAGKSCIYGEAMPCRPSINALIFT